MKLYRWPVYWDVTIDPNGVYKYLICTGLVYAFAETEAKAKELIQLKLEKETDLTTRRKVEKALEQPPYISEEPIGDYFGV